MVEMHGYAVLFRRRFQHPQAFRHHFLADPVAGNNRDPVLLFSCSSRYSLWHVPRGLVHLTGLQWTKLGRGATLHCNVDRFARRRPNS